MRYKNIAFYRGNTKVLVDFSAEGISSGGAVTLLESLNLDFALAQAVTMTFP